MSRRTSQKHVLCVSNEGYRTSLVVRRIYSSIDDAEAESRGLFRVVDESGEDYLFPAELFIAIELPSAAARAIRDDPASKPLQPRAHSRRR